MDTQKYSRRSREITQARDGGEGGSRRGERNASESIRKILHAARSVFASGGFGGARVDEVAHQAGVSKNLIYHYFGSKEGLYLAVLETELAAMRAYQDALQLDLLDPEQAMRQLIAHTFDYFVATPELLSLMNTENLLQARNLKVSTEVHALYDTILARLQAVIERGIEQGLFRRDVDLVNLYISISSLAYFYLSNRWTLSHIFRVDLAKPAMLKRRKAHIINLIMSYLTDSDRPVRPQ